MAREKRFVGWSNAATGILCVKPGETKAGRPDSPDNVAHEWEFVGFTRATTYATARKRLSTLWLLVQAAREDAAKRPITDPKAFASRVTRTVLTAIRAVDGPTMKRRRAR